MNLKFLRYRCRCIPHTSWMPVRCYGPQSKYPLITEVRYYFFTGNIWWTLHILLINMTPKKNYIKLHSMNSQEVQDNPNIIKITLRSLDHLMTTTAARASRRRAAVAAPIPESAYHCWWQSRRLHARAAKDQRPRAKLNSWIALKLLTPNL
jgi:hypothetical protein